MLTIHWYNPVKEAEEDAPVPLNDEQAIEMLSGHRDSDLFVEEYRRIRERQPDIIEALALTGETFYWVRRMD